MNFPLDKSLRAYAGVDVTEPQRWLWQQEYEKLKSTTSNVGQNSDLKRLEKQLAGKNRILKQWGRCFMGAKPSPYHAVRSTHLAEEVVRGDRLDEKKNL